MMSDPTRRFARSTRWALAAAVVLALIGLGFATGVVRLANLSQVTTALIVWGATKVYRAGAVHGAGIGDLIGMLKGAMGMKPKNA